MPGLQVLLHTSISATVTDVSYYMDEARSQPACWVRAYEQFRQSPNPMLPRGARVAIGGCGTSFYIGSAFAVLREASGAGETDAFVASQAPEGRRYDAALAISRSGDTSDVDEWLRGLPADTNRFVITGVSGSPIASQVTQPLVLDYADETSVVQTRFATTALAVLRASLGEDVPMLAKQAESAITDGAPFEAGRFRHFVFLGSGFASAIAQEAALKMRETAGVWAEAYAAPEYRHGPISATSAQTLVWALGHIEPDVVDHVRETDATFFATDLDAMAELVRVHMQAGVEAAQRGRDIDAPPFLGRAVIL